jgi:hypothetical protein
MGRIWRNSKRGLDALSNRPGFAVIAVFVVALAFGARGSILSLVDAALLSPLNSSGFGAAPVPSAADDAGQLASPAGSQVGSKPDSGTTAVVFHSAGLRSRPRGVARASTRQSKAATTSSPAVAVTSLADAKIAAQNVDSAAEAWADLGNKLGNQMSQAHGRAERAERAEFARELIAQAKQYYSNNLAIHLPGVEAAAKSLQRSAGERFNVRGSR